MTTLKSDLAQSSRNLTTACLNVYTKSGFVEVDGKPVHVGTSQDLFGQLERSKLEKTLLEKKFEDLEKRSKEIKKNFEDAKESLHKVNDENSDLKSENEKLKKNVSKLKIFQLLMINSC